jgi:hypothetical protein
MKGIREIYEIKVYRYSRDHSNDGWIYCARDECGDFIECGSCGNPDGSLDDAIHDACYQLDFGDDNLPFSIKSNVDGEYGIWIRY